MPERKTVGDEGFIVNKPNSALTACVSVGVKADNTERMLIYENGKSDYKRPSDIDICMEIDRNILPKYGKSSIYLLTRQEKQQIAEQLYRNLHIGEKQIRRCLAM